MGIIVSKNMDISEFKSGQYKQQFQYKSFQPEKINREWFISEPGLSTLLEEANFKLGELNAFSEIVPDVNLFIRMHVVKEATTSSRIEGTKTQIDEAVLDKGEIDPERRDDWIEVQNYIRAMNEAVSQLQNLPVSSRIIKTAHKILMENSRGESKLPGEYRTSQNWIGGASLKDAVFIPPHHEEIDELMGDLENFINNQQIRVPHLIRIALAHYQFETIHPFLDGNGRTGRLLITLYLVANNVLHKPTLYLSDFFERNRGIYYDNLQQTRAENNLTQWLKFFLVGVAQTAAKGTETFKSVMLLKNDIEENRIIKLGRKLPTAKKLMRHLYSHPVINIQTAADELVISKQSSGSIIKDFLRLGILREASGRQRYQLFVFEEYLSLFRD